MRSSSNILRFGLFFLLFSFNSNADNGSSGHTMVKAKVMAAINGYKKNSTTAGVNSALTDPVNYIYTNSSFTSTNDISIGSGIGFELSGSYFLTDNIAAEISMALYNKKVKIQSLLNSSTVNLPVSYNTSFSTQAKLMPLTAILQYHIAPYGKISPYIGGGYHLTLASASAGSKMKNGHGVVLQAGFDGWLDENVSVNFDVKKYSFSSTLSANLPYSSGNGGFLVFPGNKLKIDPVFIMVGVGYRI